MSGENPAPGVLTVSEVAAYLRVHPSTIYRLLKAHQLPAFRIGSDWRFNVEEINAWREAREKMAVYGAGARHTHT
jgi:excisionase family DNA binding protein